MISLVDTLLYPTLDSRNITFRGVDMSVFSLTEMDHIQKELVRSGKYECEKSGVTYKFHLEIE